MSGLVDLIFNLIELLVFVRVLMSWFNPDPYNQIVRLLYDLTEPFLRPIRERIPPQGGFDLSPIILMVILLAT